MIRWFFFI